MQSNQPEMLQSLTLIVREKKDVQLESIFYNAFFIAVRHVKYKNTFLIKLFGQRKFCIKFDSSSTSSSSSSSSSGSGSGSGSGSSSSSSSSDYNS